MSNPFQLTLQREGVPDIEIRGELSDDEHKVLTAYLQQHDELIESKPLREGMPCNISINYTKEEGMKVAAQLPTKDDLSILLHRLRPFILQDELASFARASSILGKHISDPQLRQLLREQGELYDSRQMQRVMKIELDEVLVNSERVLKDWLNSREHHRDSNKRQVIDSLFERIPGDFLRGIFVSMLIDKTYAIRNVASLIGLVLGKSKRLQFAARASQ